MTKSTQTQPDQTIQAQPAAAEKPPRRRAAKTQPPPVEASQPKGKIPILVDLLTQPDGASITAMMQATGWQAHSVRGAMSGAIKKTLGLNVISEKTEAGRVYRIVAETRA